MCIRDRSTLDGDANGDDLFESLLAFGGRSVLTLDGDLNLLHDSGDTLERRLRDSSPSALARLESAASVAGARPAAAAVLGNSQALGVALRSAGAVGFLDLLDPTTPRLTALVPTAQGAEPVDLAYFDRSDSTTFSRYILVADAANGTLDVIEWTQESP